MAAKARRILKVFAIVVAAVVVVAMAAALVVHLLPKPDL